MWRCNRLIICTTPYRDANESSNKACPTTATCNIPNNNRVGTKTENLSIGKFHELVPASMNQLN